MTTDSTCQQQQFLSASPHADLVGCHRDWDTGDALVTYYGSAEALVAAGLVAPEVLVVKGNKGPRVRRVDVGGLKFKFKTWWRGAHEGRPYRVYDLTFCRPVARVSELPVGRVGGPRACPQSADGRTLRGVRPSMPLGQVAATAAVAHRGRQHAGRQAQLRIG